MSQLRDNRLEICIRHVHRETAKSVEEVALLVGGVRSVRHGVQLLLVCCSKKRQR